MPISTLRLQSDLSLQYGMVKNFLHLPVEFIFVHSSLPLKEIDLPLLVIEVDKHVDAAPFLGIVAAKGFRIGRRIPGELPAQGLAVVPRISIVT